MGYLPNFCLKERKNMVEYTVLYKLSSKKTYVSLKSHIEVKYIFKLGYSKQVSMLTNIKHSSVTKKQKQ